MPRSLSRARSRSGAWVRRSRMTNAASSTTATTASGTDSVARSVSRARAMASTRRATPPVTVTAPGTSSFFPLPRRIRRQQPQRGCQQRNADRDVDEEDQAPRDLDQQASEHRAGREARRDDCPVGAQRTAALLLARVAGDQQGQARGSEHRRADPLHHPRGDQQAGLDGESPGDARHDEHDQADPVEPGPAVHIGEPATQQQEPAEGDRIRADQPLQRRGGDVQVTLDGGQRHVDDREVQHDHELRHGQGKQQREPGTGRIGRGFAHPSTMPCRRRCASAAPAGRSTSRRVRAGERGTPRRPGPGPDRGHQ